MVSGRLIDVTLMQTLVALKVWIDIEFTEVLIFLFSKILQNRTSTENFIQIFQFPFLQAQTNIFYSISGYWYTISETMIDIFSDPWK